MNIFDQPGYAVVTTNTVGVMGAGIAKQSVNRYGSSIPKEYKQFLASGRHAIGKPTHSQLAPIVYFATKKHWRDPSQLEWIEQSLDYLANHFAKHPPTSDYWFPPLGCGLGRLNPDDVRALFDTYLGDYERCHPVGF